jgi:hypothetical protein
MREEDFQFDFSKNCSVFHFFLRVHSCSCCEEDQFGTDLCSISLANMTLSDWQPTAKASNLPFRQPFLSELIHNLLATWICFTRLNSLLNFREHVL